MSIPPGTSTRTELQSRLDSLPVGATWHLAQGEYAGPLIISKPLMVDGRGATIWASFRAGDLGEDPRE